MATLKKDTLISPKFKFESELILTKFAYLLGVDVLLILIRLIQV